MKKTFLALAVIAAATAAANAQIKISEVSYKSLFGEFIEIANTATTGGGISLSGWSYDDSSNDPDTVPLPAVSLAPQETLIITEVSEELFRLAWFEDSEEGDPITLKAVVENNVVNLGKEDTIYIYDQTDAEVDSLEIDDAVLDTEDDSGVPGTYSDFSTWENSSNVAGSWKAGAPGATGPVGSPGVLVTAP